jgi:zinc-binding alcohol dehydrogenase family protein
MEDTTQMAAVMQTAALPIEDDSSLVDASIPVPMPGPFDVLVEVRAVSVNPVDVKLRSVDPDGPRVLGFDAAGVVVKVGERVTQLSTGDEVYYAGAIDRPGSNAALQAVDERIVAKKPVSLSFAAAAALPLTSLTAWECLFDKLRLDSGRTGTLLIIGGAGGVGSMAIQLAKALLPGVRVVATASRAESEEWVRHLGADEIINHSGDIVQQLSDAAPDGVDWILTTNSVGQIPVYERVLKPFGEIVAIDDPATVDVTPLKSKAISWHWAFMFARSLHQSSDMHRQHEILAEVARLVDSGKVRTTAMQTLAPIDAATLREAHALVEGGRVIGKVVLDRAEQL